jgi:rubrerythrin
MMDLTKYSIEDLVLTAIKSEVEANSAYSNVAKRVDNFFLKDKLRFLASEEEKHREFLESLYKNMFPGKDIRLPEESPVPLPAIVIPSERMQLSIVLESAMGAEKAAHDFYQSLADMMENEAAKKTLQYIASMERGHYKLLEIERANALQFEEFDQIWPMMHSGP